MDRLDVGVSIAITVFAGCVYAATAARDIVVGDTGDFLTTAATLGVAHPPGYPLLVLLGHLFALAPLGPLPLRMNMLAVMSDALTVGLIFATARRLGTSRWAAIIAALSLALNPNFWQWSLAIEAFPLNNMLAALLVYFLVRWEASPEREAFLVAAALCGGLGAANHLTIIFLIPMVAFVAWRRRQAIGIRTVLMCVAAIVVGLLPYLYIPLAAARDPFLNWGNVSSAHGLLRHFLRSDYGTGQLVAPGGSSGSPVERLAGLSASFTFLEATLIVVGAAAAFRRVRWYFWGCLASFTIAGPAFAAYANMDVSNPPLLWALTRFFLLPHVIVAPLAAFGVVTIAELAATRVRREYVAALVVVPAAALILVPAFVRYRGIDQSRNHLAHTFATDILSTLEPNSVLLAPGDEVVFPVAYVQAVEKARPDVTLVMLGLFRSFDWYIQQLRRRDPTLTIPFDHYDSMNPAATLRAFVAANPRRPFALVGSPSDTSLSGAYWLYRRGLVERIEPMAADITLEAAAEENERLYQSYHVPAASTVRRNTFEISILAKYARAPAALGDQFALAHLNRQATVWYQRALTIDPQDLDARTALAKLESKSAP